MTDYGEEQRNELEAIESIYPDSFTGKTDRKCMFYAYNLPVSRLAFHVMLTKSVKRKSESVISLISFSIAAD